MGTIFSVDNSAPSGGAPVLAPVSPAEALHAAALALNRLADSIGQLVSAVQGKLVTPQIPSLTPARVNVASDPTTVSNAVNAFLIAKARAAKSDRYLRTMKNSLTKFARGRATRYLDDVTVDEIERWLNDSDWNGTTRRGYLRDVRTMYHFAVRRGMAVSNPPCSVELPERSPSEIGIHTPAEAAKVLECARRLDANLCRAMAVRYFAGLRSSECDRLTEDCIRLDTGYVEVTAVNARKTRKRRLVEISDTLRAWLDLGGKLPVGNSGQRMAELVKLSGVPWPKNATRHSFVTYSVALHGSKDTALRAGHSEDMLFQHYRALVTKEQAEEFWKIRPA